MKSLLALIGASVIISLGGGPPPGQPHGGEASDEAPDVNSEAAQALLAGLRAAHISYSRADQVIITAEGVCKLAGDGKSGPEVLAAIENNSPGLTEGDAAKFLEIAERSYCPQQLVPSDTEGG